MIYALIYLMPEINALKNNYKLQQVAGFYVAYYAGI